MLKKIVILLLLSSSLAIAQDIEQSPERGIEKSAEEITAPTDAYDCTVVQLEAVDDTRLTKTEIIERMDSSLLDSIDQYDTCIDQVVNSNAESDSGAQADSGLAGEDSETGNESSQQGESNTQAENATEQTNSEADTNRNREQVKEDAQLEGNGAQSQDIAPQDNDSAVCRLLKNELKIEQDPKKQSELKEIYNNYKCRG